MTPSPPPVGRSIAPRRPAASEVMAGPSAGRRFQLHVSECVETKTVTTTTCLTRKFPHVFVRDPTPLDRLDAKEFPLAMKPTPAELLCVSYNLDDVGDGSLDVGHQRGTTPASEAANYAVKPPGTAVKIESLSQRFPPAPTASNQHSYPLPDSLRQHPYHTRATLLEQAKSSSSSKSTSSSADPPVLPTAFKALSSKALWAPLSHEAALNKLRRPGLGSHATFGHQSVGKSASTDDESGISSDLDRVTSNHDHLMAAPLSRHQGLTGEAPRAGSGYLVTPDSSGLSGSSPQPLSRRRLAAHPESLRGSPPDAPPSLLHSALCEVAASPSGSDSLTAFGSNVATPPITDADAAPFADADADDPLQRSVRSMHHRPAIDVVATQDASLPSPRLSPTLAASQLPLAEQDDDDGATASFHTSVAEPSSLASIDDFRVKRDDDAENGSLSWLDADKSQMARLGPLDASPPAAVVDTQTLLEVFDSMKPDMKSFMMYQFLRRCPRSTLRVVAEAVNPVLKCDFLKDLPLELSYHVLSFLDCRDLCRAAQVSKLWRSIVDGNETGWKELIDHEGFVFPPGELQKAIEQGWGWQDPVGPAGRERDLSVMSRLTHSEAELTRDHHRQVAPKLRSSKRKRGINAYSAKERSKRRAGAAAAAAAGAPDAPASSAQMANGEWQQSRSEGPLTAASAAAEAVPDPQMGLPSLRQLHLFKSMYRRHHMIRRSWTSGEVKPSHVAFAAHPRHVITCLQFDDDKIITGSDDTLIHIYDTKTGKLRKRLAGHEGGVWALQYEGNVLVSGSTDRSVRVWDMERGLCQQVFYGHTSTVRCLQILLPTETGRDATGRPLMQPEKPLIITGSRDSQLRVWRLPQPGSRRYIQTHPPAQESDCPYFIRPLTGHGHSVRAISAHGDTLVSGSYDSTVRVWRISTGESLHVLRGHSQKVYSVVLDHQRNRCISGSMDSLVKTWDLTTGACLHTLEGHTLLVGLLDLRDERLVSAAADSTLRIWDPDTGRCEHTLMAHTGAITCFQHDGQKVISGSEKTVKMWDVGTGDCVQDLLTDLSGVWQVKFDGRRCIAAVQRDQLTYVEILDFGAIRDGEPPENLGKRILLSEHEIQEIMDDGLA